LINAIVALAAMIVYLLLLFGIAYYADHRRKLGQSIVSNPYVYALSLSVYCTAWTFYGSIGRAASTGLSFLTIYLGPTLAMLLGWLLIRKMIRISKEYRLTSISDFISFRYGRSYAIGALVTIIAIVAITPYVALQLIAVSNSITIISGEQLVFGVRRLIVTLLLGVFAIIFGARHLDPMERHEGLIAAVAFESIVKLVAFIAAGIYITYGIFGGYRSILEGISSSPEYSHLLQVDYIPWFSLTLISFFSVLLLPRQFHVMVVENSAEDHLKKAMWLFPLYLLLINLFAPAIAWGGLLLNTPGDPDMFIINIPIINGHDLLAFFIFIGGTSAATAMVLVSSVAVGIMMLNGLEMPHLVRWIGKGRNLPSLLLNMKRVNILIVLSLGYIYSLAVEYQSLVDIGLVSLWLQASWRLLQLGGSTGRKDAVRVQLPDSHRDFCSGLIQP
jgi:Na+/proline symporter